MAFFLIGFVVSSIGFVLLSYGRKLRRPPQLVAGLALLIMPYVVPTLVFLLLSTAVTLGLMWLALTQDW